VSSATGFDDLNEEAGEGCVLCDKPSAVVDYPVFGGMVVILRNSGGSIWGLASGISWMFFGPAMKAAISYVFVADDRVP
jgi:hypothetical protein